MPPVRGPTAQLKEMLESLGARGKKLGIETNSYGLTYANGKALDDTLHGFCRLIEATHIIDRLRLVKSQAELAYVRKAGKLADLALKAAVAETRAGADEGRILAAQQAAVFAGGGDYPGNEFIIGSGKDALLCRYKAGRRKLAKNDQLTLEFAGVYRHYHAALMRTIIIGKPSLAMSRWISPAGRRLPLARRSCARGARLAKSSPSMPR